MIIPVIDDNWISSRILCAIDIHFNADCCIEGLRGVVNNDDINNFSCDGNDVDDDDFTVTLAIFLWIPILNVYPTVINTRNTNTFNIILITITIITITITIIIIIII